MGSTEDVGRFEEKEDEKFEPLVTTIADGFEDAVAPDLSSSFQNMLDQCRQMQRELLVLIGDDSKNKHLVRARDALKRAEHWLTLLKG